jgi:signal transduction histidine kinase
LQSLINSILEISAEEQKKLLQNYHVYNTSSLVKELFEESCEKFRVTKDNYKITCDASCEIVASKDALKIVIDNLVDNAVKYSTQQAKIAISVICNSKKVTILFTDLGIGIVANEQKKIFNKFYRIYNKEIPNVKGTGLGLYRVREIVKAHGGKITVSSEGEGKGTTFKIEMPAYKAINKRRLKKLLKNEK